MTAPILHTTAIALWSGDGWRGVLLRGPSGAGKSDLALRAMAQGWRLVADDRAVTWASEGRLFVRAPAILRGLIEARGLGVEQVSVLPMAEIFLLADLVDDAASVERIPAPDSQAIEGVTVRRIALFGATPSAVQKLTLALQAATLGVRPERAYQARLARVAETPGANQGASQEE